MICTRFANGAYPVLRGEPSEMQFVCSSICTEVLKRDALCLCSIRFDNFSLHGKFQVLGNGLSDSFDGVSGP